MNIRNQRGSILLYALLIMIAMLAISITLAGVFTSKLQSLTEASNSVHAIYAADSAIEACLFEARKQPAAPVTRPILTNGATFEIASLSATVVDVSDDCRLLGIDSFRFRVVGTVSNVSRAIEVSQ